MKCVLMRLQDLEDCYATLEACLIAISNFDPRDKEITKVKDDFAYDRLVETYRDTAKRALEAGKLKVK